MAFSSLSLFFSPLFLVLPAPIKALVVVAGGFLFLGFERQEKVHEVRPAVEAHAEAPAEAE
jgi:hypothetical protein